MSFRFRRSVSIAPGLRINFGKTGASVSAGVRGAHITFGRGGTRTTVGIPGTGASYTQKVGGKKARTGAASMLLIIPLLIMGVLVRLSRHGSSSSREFAAVIVTVVVVGLIGLVAALVRRPVPTNEATENGATAEAATGQDSNAELPGAPGPSVGPQIPPQRVASLKAIMREATANKQRRDEEENLARQEHQLAGNVEPV